MKGGLLKLLLHLLISSIWCVYLIQDILLLLPLQELLLTAMCVHDDFFIAIRWCEYAVCYCCCCWVVYLLTALLLLSDVRSSSASSHHPRLTTPTWDH